MEAFSKGRAFACQAFPQLDSLCEPLMWWTSCCLVNHRLRGAVFAPPMPGTELMNLSHTQTTTTMPPIERAQLHQENSMPSTQLHDNTGTSDTMQ